jgi:hypothetical protein
MQPAEKQKIIELFNRACPPAIRDEYSDEGLNLLLDFIERDIEQDGLRVGAEFEIKPKTLYEKYYEESCVEFIEYFQLDLGFDKYQSETEKQSVMENVITEYLSTRGFLVGFTSEGRVVSAREVAEPEPPENEMHEFD